MIFLELVDRRGRPSMAGLHHPTHARPAPMPSALPMAVAQTGSRATSILSACRDRLGIHDRGRSNQLRPPDLRPNSGLEREPNYRRRIGPARDGGRHHAGLVALSSVVVVVFVHTMSVDGDTAVHAAAKQLADRRRSARYGVGVSGRNRGAGRPGPYIRNEDQVALGVGCDRVRAGRLWNGLDEDTGSVNNPEHGTGAERRAGWFDRPAGTQIVAVITRVEEDLVRPGDLSRAKNP